MRLRLERLDWLVGTREVVWWTGWRRRCGMNLRPLGISLALGRFEMLMHVICRRTLSHQPSRINQAGRTKTRLNKSYQPSQRSRGSKVKPREVQARGGETR